MKKVHGKEKDQQQQQQQRAAAEVKALHNKQE